LIPPVLRPQRDDLGRPSSQQGALSAAIRTTAAGL